MTIRSRFPGARTQRESLAPAFLLAVLVLAGCSSRESATVDEAASEVPWFTEITAEMGLDAHFTTGGTGEAHMPEVVSGGCVLFDADGDGDLDVYLSNGNELLPDAGVSTIWRNSFFRQEPSGRLVEATDESGLGDGGYAMGFGIGDVDNDGDLDVYVANYGADRLYLNRGDGRFEDATAGAGIDVDNWSSSVALLDFDRDGWLDIYVARYVQYDPSVECFGAAGRPDFCGPKNFDPISDRLLRGLGGGKFEDVSEPAGITGAKGAGLGVICGDYDGDGWVDIYVANDAWDNQLWMNQGDGTFKNEALQRGAAYNMQGTAEAGMGLESGDLDGDGHEDLFITHLTGETNTFLRNMGGRAVFDDWSGRTNLARPSTPYTGFGTVALDLENDGDLDLVVANGGVRREHSVPGADLSRGVWAEMVQPNQLFLNDGAGLFAAAAPESDGLLTQLEVSRGLAMGDIDGDGDLDLLVTSIDGPAHLFRNDVPKLGHWLRVRALLPDQHRDAIGARITVHLGERRIFRTIRSGSSYQSISELVAHFGLGQAEAIDAFDVVWPDGSRERFPGCSADREVILRQGQGGPPS